MRSVSLLSAPTLLLIFDTRVTAELHASRFHVFLKGAADSFVESQFKYNMTFSISKVYVQLVWQQETFHEPNHNGQINNNYKLHLFHVAFVSIYENIRAAKVCFYLHNLN